VRGRTIATEAIEQAVDRDEVRECSHSVDLDHGQMLAGLRFEDVDAADVDELERELQLGLRLADDLDRPVAEVTALGVVERDPAHARSGRYG
jgi:hypothetical protein